MDERPISYRPEIDGLRAVAVIAVVLCHAKLGASGGYVGVDVFFVISGYLITSLLFKEYQSGSVNISAFWERRIRRILPALVVVTVATLAAGWFLLLPADYQELAESVAAQSLFCSNVFFWMHTSYFDGAAEFKPLLHTWSLAVEEQFYMFFPLLALGLTKLRRPMIGVALVTVCIGLVAINLSEVWHRPRVMTGYSMYALAVFGLAFIRKPLPGFAFASIVVGSFLLSVDGASHHPVSTFYLLPFRAWELGLGAVLAVTPRTFKVPGWIDEVLSAAGIGMILLPVVCYNESTRFPGIAALLPCLGAALVIYANDVRKTATGRFLSSRPLVFVGLMSYSLYLWHWPVLVLANYWTLEPLAWTVRLSLVALSFGLAVASWKYVETPFRKKRFVAGAPGIFRFAGISAAVLLVFAFSVAGLGGVRARLPERAVHYAEFQFDVDRAFGVEVSLQDAKEGHFVPFGSTRPEDPLNVFVWGDSHAKVVLPVIDELCRRQSLRGCSAAHSATAPLLDYVLADDRFGLGIEAPAFAQSVLSFIQAHQIKDIILVARWAGYGAGKLPEFNVAFRKTIAALRAQGVRVWAAKDVPMFPWDVPKALAGASLFGTGPEKLKLPPGAVGRYLAELSDQAGEFLSVSEMGIHVLDPSPFLSSKEEFYAAKDGKALYRDKEHLTTHGAALLRPMFAPVFGL